MTQPRWRRLASTTLFVAKLIVATAFLPFATHAAPRERLDTAPAHWLSVRWSPVRSDTNKVAVTVAGLSAGSLRELRRANWEPAQWQRLLSVYAGPGPSLTDSGVPPMLGAYSIQSGVLRFEPLFSLESGIQYRAVLRTDQLPGKRQSRGISITSVFEPPVQSSEPTTLVSQVYPSADVLPENLLKFYIHFSAPMSRGQIYEHIHLRNESGKDIELPFLEIDEELWDPTMTRLTLFIDPGRIKREVRPLEEIGPALEAGKAYMLVIDRTWQDGSRRLLKESFQKRFRVGPPDRDPPEPAHWTIQPPRRNTRETLSIGFSDPMDHALAQRVIRVTRASGDLVGGEVKLEDQERRWTFAPVNAWRPGSYRLVVNTTIEDLAGNNIGKPFEVDLFENVERRPNTSTVALPFEIH